ncbi:MAG: metallophosphoesterase [Ruminococcus sp.]|nr:metallophosphoesterase [Candidatus Copronaster equi]
MKNNKFSPIGGSVVCAVGSNYIICIPAKTSVLIKVEVGENTYYCHSNGIRISDSGLHKITVPSDVLDKEKKYTVVYETVNERFDYSCDKQPPVSVEYSFKPIEKTDDIKIYHLSDVHDRSDAAVEAGSFFGKELDLLILNGDISSGSNSQEDIIRSFEIAHSITKGEIPCIFSRGNHDLRGKCAEKLESFMPTDNGKSYFSVRVGSMWFLVLDCGEDKLDTHREYSGTVAFHQFRVTENAFVDSIIKNKAEEYEADGVVHRFVLCHVPFCYDDNDECKGERPFNIEQEIYTDWSRKINENIKPDMSVFGHLHVVGVYSESCPFDNKGLGGNIILGGMPADKNKSENNVIGTAFNVYENEIRVRFTDRDRTVSEDKIIKI